MARNGVRQPVCSAVGWLALAMLAAPVAAVTFTVINTADSGAGSLRQAILDANTLPGADRIEFAIAGAGVQTITPATALPTITDAVVVDGYTQPGSSPNTLATGSDAVLLIELNGNGGGFTGLNVTANASTLRGLVVNRFSTGISVNGDNDEVYGCYVGVDPTGTIDRGNTSGIVDQQGADDARIGSAAPADRNVVAGNNGDGIRSLGERTLVVGNYVGTNAAGTAAIGNVTGVEIVGNDSVVGGANATPGGACSGACNLIAGNSGIALLVNVFIGPVFRTDVRGNYVGTDVSGLAPLPNLDGIALGNARLTTVGALAGTAADRNVVAGNANRGIYFDRGGRTNPVTSLNTLARNYVGLGASGAALGNGGRGIELTDSFQNEIIENVVAHNGGTGIYIDVGLGTPSTGFIRNRMQRNTVFANGGMGIDLEPPAALPTPNDTGDADNGANTLQNYPILDSATTVLGTTEVTGRFNSLPSTTFKIELFGSSTCDTSGFGEAEAFLGDLMVTTNASGNAPVHAFVPAPPGNGPVSATATDPNGNTSELSACRVPDALRPVANDFDGDRNSDIAIFRPSTGEWYILGSTMGGTIIGWGESGDLPATGDYDGDGTTDVAVFRPSAGAWYLRRSTAGGLFVPWGESGDVPVPADYDGDGITDVAVYRPSNNVWYVIRSRGGVRVQEWGDPGDVAAPADFDGDGIADFAIFRPSEGWYLAQTSAGGKLVVVGGAGDEPLPADYDGDGRADPAFFRPGEGNWYLYRSTAGDTVVGLGTSGDFPVAGDYDGDGVSDLGVFRDSEGGWYLEQSTAGSLFVPWGESGDRAIGGRPQP